MSTDLWSHSALSAVVELGLLDQLGAPRTVSELSSTLGLERPLTEALVDLLVEAGALERDGDRFAPTDGFEAYLDEPLKSVLMAELRSDRFQAADLIARSRAGELHGGWDHTDRQLLEAQGETGRIFRIAMDFLLPQLDGLIDSLERPGAAFLDVGAGVGVLSIELCQAFREARSLALEPHRPARALGELKVADAGVGDRVEFRGLLVEELSEHEAFDLAYVPQAFLPPEAFEVGLERVRAALRPGAWVICLSLELSGEQPLEIAVRRLKARLWGGGALPAENVDASLERAGFEDVRPNPPLGAYRTVAARRP